MTRFRWLCIGFFLGAVATALCIIGIAYTTAPRWYRVLFVGSDQRGIERARSDVMIVLNIPRDTSKAPVLLSIPRDTKVLDSEYGLQKMTHFYAFGERPEGKLLGNIDLTQAHIEELLGLSIDATVEVSFASFIEIVNALGGACVEQECDTHGDVALKIIRDRFSDGRSDFSRQDNEREVITSLIGKAATQEGIARIAQIFATSQTARIQYDQSTAIRFAIGYVLSHKGNLSFGEYQSLSVPGSSDMVFTESFGKKLYYWVPDTTQLSELVRTSLQ